MYNNVLQVFYDVFLCIVSLATIAVGDRAATERLRDRDNAALIHNNATGVGNNCRNRR